MYTTQKTAVSKIVEHLSNMNLVMLSMSYKKGKRIEVTTSNGVMIFQYGNEFKLVNK